MLNRPDSYYKKLFVSLLLLQSLVLLSWALFQPVFSAYEQDLLSGAANMRSTGQWWYPQALAGEAIWHTPPLPYWLSAAGSFLFPDSLAGFRLLPLLLSISAFWGFYEVVRRFLDARTAFYSCAILFASLLFGWRLQLNTPDSLATIGIYAALFGFYLSLKTARSSYNWLLYGGLTFCLLVNGLVPFFLASIIMVLYLMFKIKMNSESLQKIKAGKGYLLSLALGLPWFISAVFVQQSPDFIILFAGSYLKGGNVLLEDAFYMPFVFGLLALLPFGLFLPKAFANGWKYRQRKDLLLLSVLGLLSPLFLFAFTQSFYPHYLLPALPFAAILIGFKFSQLAGRNLRKMDMPVEMALLLILAFLLPGGLVYFMGWGFGLEYYETLLFWLALAVLPIGTITSLLLFFNKRTDNAIAVLAVSYLLFNGLLMALSNKNAALDAVLKAFLS